MRRRKKQILLILCCSTLLIVVIKLFLHARGSSEKIRDAQDLVRLDTSGDQVQDCRCQCHRLRDQPDVPHHLIGRSVCGESADRRGPGQNVISFSFYGSVDSVYFHGIEKNLRLMDELYPGYIMRVYHDKRNVDNGGRDCLKLCGLQCRSTKVDLCGVRDLNNLGDISRCAGLIWRFAPMIDPLVAVWHSRDLDSVLTKREADAVRDWEDNSQATFHVMRDHPYHRTKVLGGMFGMRRGFSDAGQVFGIMVNRSIVGLHKNQDQDLLRRHLWPLMKTDAVVHDSYLCQKIAGGEIRPWPTKRKSSDDFLVGEPNNFVGANGGSMISLKTHGACPEPCRPKDHLDWKLC